MTLTSATLGVVASAHLLAACSAGTGTVGQLDAAIATAVPDADSFDAAPEGSCDLQVRGVSEATCGAYADLYVCASAPPPRADCTRAPSPENYCCRWPGPLPYENPYGAQYPTADIGTRARAGMRAGQRLKNFQFLGYENGTNQAATVTLSMARFYDPEQRISPPIKLLRMVAVSRWDPASDQLARSAEAVGATLRNQGIVWLTVVVEGSSRGVPARVQDLAAWAQAHPMSAPLAMDPGARSLGVFFDAAAVPWAAWVDARSMEILSDGAGASSPDLSNEVASELAAWASRPVKP